MVKDLTFNQRCSWCGQDPLYQHYHDTVWGVPERDSERLFAKLVLDGAQAGLSWIAILKKEQGYYEAFDGLKPEIMAEYSAAKIEMLMSDRRIVRNKAKIAAAIENAKAYLRLKEKGIDFSRFVWDFVEGNPVQNYYVHPNEVPAQNTISKSLSKRLIQEGFKFVGPTITYAWMQATGMVNDHLVSCFRHEEVRQLSLGSTGPG